MKYSILKKREKLDLTWTGGRPRLDRSFSLSDILNYSTELRPTCGLDLTWHFWVGPHLQLNLLSSVEYSIFVESNLIFCIMTLATFCVLHILVVGEKQKAK